MRFFCQRCLAVWLVGTGCARTNDEPNPKFRPLGEGEQLLRSRDVCIGEEWGGVWEVCTVWRVWAVSISILSYYNVWESIPHGSRHCTDTVIP
ncbi:hypothetical protein EDC01DRAFT_659391 [Geopyxis carbonaria]|nr:hypothetical protein EDC01DRAFT_659391 [Geopyxis carbonaria]